MNFFSKLKISQVIATWFYIICMGITVYKILNNNNKYVIIKIKILVVRFLTKSSPKHVRWPSTKHKSKFNIPTSRAPAHNANIDIL